MTDSIKKAIEHLERALTHLDYFTQNLESDDPVYQVLDNLCYEIRDAYRDLKELP